MKLDADVTFRPDFFERILAAFSAEPRLGITGGLCFEQDADGGWRPTYVTRGHVRGATRAYRAACFADVLPLEERMGWDGIDELRARVAGWETGSIETLPFKHHRKLGAREDRWEKWVGQGRMSHYMGYRPRIWQLARCTEACASRERWGCYGGFGAAALRREPRFSDPAVRAYLRDQQSIRAFPRRILEALGRSSTGRSGTRVGRAT